MGGSQSDILNRQCVRSDIQGRNMIAKGEHEYRLTASGCIFAEHAVSRRDYDIEVVCLEDLVEASGDSLRMGSQLLGNLYGTTLG